MRLGFPDKGPTKKIQELISGSKTLLLSEEFVRALINDYALDYDYKTRLTPSAFVWNDHLFSWIRRSDTGLTRQTDTNHMEEDLECAESKIWWKHDHIHTHTQDHIKSSGEKSANCFQLWTVRE